MTTNARDEKWSGWIDWNGGSAPLEPTAFVEIKTRDGDIEDGEAVAFYWLHDREPSDIISYRYKIKEPESVEVTEAEEEAWQTKERQLIGSPRTADRFLHQAAELMAERGKQYDQPGGERSMGKAVAALNAITGRDLTEAEGWLLMSLVKRVRQHSGAGYHQDSAEDAVAYAALEAEALEANRATS